MGMGGGRDGQRGPTREGESLPLPQARVCDGVSRAGRAGAPYRPAQPGPHGQALGRASGEQRCQGSRGRPPPRRLQALSRLLGAAALKTKGGTRRTGEGCWAVPQGGRAERGSPVPGAGRAPPRCTARRQRRLRATGSPEAARLAERAVGGSGGTGRAGPGRRGGGCAGLPGRGALPGPSWPQRPGLRGSPRRRGLAAGVSPYRLLQPGG